MKTLSLVVLSFLFSLPVNAVEVERCDEYNTIENKVRELEARTYNPLSLSSDFDLIAARDMGEGATVLVGETLSGVTHFALRRLDGAILDHQEYPDKLTMYPANDKTGTVFGVSDNDREIVIYKNRKIKKITLDHPIRGLASHVMPIDGVDHLVLVSEKPSARQIQFMNSDGKILDSNVDLPEQNGRLVAQSKDKVYYSGSQGLSLYEASKKTKTLVVPRAGTAMNGNLSLLPNGKIHYILHPTPSTYQNYLIDGTSKKELGTGYLRVNENGEFALLKQAGSVDGSTLQLMDANGNLRAERRGVLDVEPAKNGFLVRELDKILLVASDGKIIAEKVAQANLGVSIGENVIQERDSATIYKAGQNIIRTDRIPILTLGVCDSSSKPIDKNSASGLSN